MQGYEGDGLQLPQILYTSDIVVSEVNVLNNWHLCSMKQLYAGYSAFFQLETCQVWKTDLRNLFDQAQLCGDDGVATCVESLHPVQFDDGQIYVVFLPYDKRV